MQEHPRFAAGVQKLHRLPCVRSVSAAVYPRVGRAREPGAHLQGLRGGPWRARGEGGIAARPGTAVQNPNWTGHQRCVGFARTSIHEGFVYGRRGHSSPSEVGNGRLRFGAAVAS